MKKRPKIDWKKIAVGPDTVLSKIEPGARIFLGTGAGEPRTLVKHLMQSQADNLVDLELIQLASLGDVVGRKDLDARRYRLKTFFPGMLAGEAITAGRIDLIPCRFSEIPRLFESGQITVDVAFVQISAPNDAGYCSLGVAVDVSRIAMGQAGLVAGEIDPQIPMTLGDTLVHISEFNYLVRATQPPHTFERWPVADVYDQLATHVASVIENGSCIAFSVGPLYEAMARHLVHKQHLGIHSPFFTDALMDLVNSGAVTNRKKGIFRGKSLTCYALGTPDLLSWLDQNPIVEFQGLDKVFDPMQIGRNPRFMSIIPARKVDLTGRIVLHDSRGSVITGPGDIMDMLHGAEISDGGLRIFALPSRNLKDKPNIRIDVRDYPNQLNFREGVDMVVTEFGVASLLGRTVRERAQALVEIAHPDDRLQLIEAAKAARILYPDQIFLVESAHLYPSEITARHTFKGNLTVRFRAIRPSDEEAMRRLFYRFSDQAVYYRYFSPIKTMPHAAMQKYVNIDYSQVMSIVGLIGDPGKGKIIAEARFVKDRHAPYAEVAFVVDENYQGYGIASYMYNMLVRLAMERGLQGFTAEVLATNKAMMKVFEKAGQIVKARLEHGVYTLTIPFSENK
jgi:acyl-CoA hydrolase/GNAT superfamily N-acetyltransferase